LQRLAVVCWAHRFSRCRWNFSWRGAWWARSRRCAPALTHRRRDFAQRINIKTGDELEGLANQSSTTWFAAAGILARSGKQGDHGFRTQRVVAAKTATSEVLQVISSSPGELEPVFEKMLENATRVCGANSAR